MTSREATGEAARKQNMKQNEKEGTDPITIVSGLPRSGTSLMMQMLVTGGIPALADGIRQPDEDNPRGYYEFERVKQLEQDTAWLEEAQGKVVKMVYRLLYDLPAGYSYRVVFMTRALEEVIASQEVMLQRQGKAGDQLDDARLLAIYQRQRQEVLDWLTAQPHFSLLVVDYHEVLRQPEQVSGDLNGFLGGELDTAAMLQVPEWSLYRQRRDAQPAPVPDGR